MLMTIKCLFDLLTGQKVRTLLSSKNLTFDIDQTDKHSFPHYLLESKMEIWKIGTALYVIRWWVAFTEKKENFVNANFWKCFDEMVQWIKFVHSISCFVESVSAYGVCLADINAGVIVLYIYENCRKKVILCRCW